MQTESHLLNFFLLSSREKIKKQENLWLNFPKCNGYWFREKKWTTEAGSLSSKYYIFYSYKTRCIDFTFVWPITYLKYERDQAQFFFNFYPKTWKNNA